MIDIKLNDIKIKLILEYNIKKELINALLLDEDIFKVFYSKDSYF